MRQFVQQASADAAPAKANPATLRVHACVSLRIIGEENVFIIEVAQLNQFIWVIARHHKPIEVRHGRQGVLGAIQNAPRTLASQAQGCLFKSNRATPKLLQHGRQGLIDSPTVDGSKIAIRRTYGPSKPASRASCATEGNCSVGISLSATSASNVVESKDISKLRCL